MYVSYEVPSNLISRLSSPIENGGLLFSSPFFENEDPLFTFLEASSFFQENLQLVSLGVNLAKFFYKHTKLRDHIKYLIIDKKDHSFIDYLDHFEFYQFRNDPLTISVQIMQFLSKTCRDEHQYILEIDGNYRYLTIPLTNFRFQKEPHYIFYQTDQGIVVIWTVSKVRKISGKYFNQCLLSKY